MDLTAMSIEDLMNVKVTSVSKTEQKLSRTASAVFVITQEDIERDRPNALLRLAAERGRIEDVIYLGAITRYVIAPR